MSMIWQESSLRPGILPTMFQTRGRWMMADLYRANTSNAVSIESKRFCAHMLAETVTLAI